MANRRCFKIGLLAATLCMLAGLHAEQTITTSAGDDMQIRVLSCDGKVSTLTAPPGYNYVWFKASDSLLRRIPNYWDSLPAEGTFRKDGSLKGKFSISPTQKVHFSQGNLEYRAYDHQFRFAREQWSTTYIPYGYHGQRDDNGWTSYVPWDSISSWSGNIELQNSPLGHEWFLMTQEQWEYLFRTRKNAAKRWGFCVINDLMCMVLLPDSWSCPAGLTFTPQNCTFHEEYGENIQRHHPYYHVLNGTSNINANHYTIAEWRLMEKAGAVAFPIAGFSGSEILGYNRYGDYWLNTPYNDSFAYGSFISNGTVHLKSEFARAPNYAFMVRMTRLTDDTPRDTVPIDTIPSFVQDSCITIDWNQMAKEYVPHTSLICDTLENEIRYTSTLETTVSNRLVYTKGLSAPPSHKVLVHARFKTNFSEKLYFRYFNGSDYKHITQNFTPNEWYEYTDIIEGYNHATTVWSSFLVAKYHPGEYFSLPREGGIMIFDLTQMFGAGNEPTKEQFLARFPDLNYPYTEGELRQLCDFAVSDTLHVCPHEAQPLAGTLNGLFSVSDSTQVHFSQGNLQYQPSSKTWRFASEQWETRGKDNNHPSTSTTNWLDLFAWGCSGYSKGITWYNPVRRGKYPDHIANFFIAGDPSLSMTGQYAEVDWGVHNPISNGGDRAGLWRTMTYKEWKYLMFDRPNAAQRRAYVNVEGNKGLVFLPDAWTTPDGLTIITDNTGPDSAKVDADFSDNNYTIVQWRQLEQAGAVFLPLTGICSTSGQYSPTTGWYWTASPVGPDMCYCLHFNQTAYDQKADLGGCYRTHAIAVRLVIDKHKMDSLKTADNRFLRRYPTVQWNQLLYDINYDHRLVRLDTMQSDERRYEVLRTEVNDAPAVYTSGTDAPYGHRVVVHIRFKSNFTETPYLHYSDGVNEGGLYPERYTPNEWCTIIGKIDGFVPGAVTGLMPDSSSYHAGEYISLPKDGGFMVFDLTRMFGAGNEPNLDEFLRLFPQDNFPYDKGTEFSMCDVAVQAEDNMQALNHTGPGDSNEGKLNGFFSVSANKLVRFSKGNLQYQPSTNTWRFAEHQYAVTGTQNNNPSAITDKWLDLFPFGTSGWSSGAMRYQPWEYSLEGNRDEYAVSGVFHSMTGHWRQLDWGYNPIVNGGNREDLWRTMTSLEWRYLLRDRPNASQLVALATVCDIQGLLLLPDDWLCPEGISVVCNHSHTYTRFGYAVASARFSDNIYDASQWQLLERSGAVFLPTEGTRATNSFNPQEGGYYATSPSVDGTSTSCIYFCLKRNQEPDSVISAECGWAPQIGLSVRLVIDKEKAEQAQNDYLHYDSGLLDNVDCPLAATNGMCKPTVEVGPNGVYTLTLDVTEGYPRADTLGTFRMNFPLYILEGHETDQFYIQFKYKRLQGNGDFTTFDWCDRTPVTILKKVTTESYTYLLLKLPILAQKTNDVQYSNANRFLDVNSVLAGDVYRIWDIKLGANPWADPMDLAEVKNFESFATTGVFTVGEGKQMLFSPGNLQYQASSNTWRFAEQQYDAIGVRNKFIAPDYTGWIDLLGWGTSGYDVMPKSLSLRNCYPWSYDTLRHDHTYNPNRYMYGPGEADTIGLTGNNALHDWGVYNAIANGGNIRGLWRTPKDEEFTYMFHLRPNAAALKAYATVCGSKGLIVLPDGCELPSGFPYVPSSSSTDYTANSYTYAQWKVLERLGALFLPTTGDRYGRNVRAENPPEVGYYWTADAISANDSLFIGQAVRLATEVLSTDSQLVVKADSSIWCCRLSSPDTTFILAARAIGRWNDYNFEEYDTLCYGDTLEWHDQALTRTGTYTDSLMTIYGCDSVYTMHLTVPHHSDSVTNVSICQGETYLWHGQTYSAETHIIDTLVNAVGCDSICSLHLTILYHSDSVTTASICQGETYLWHGQTFTESVSLVDTIPNAVGCDSICTLHLTVLQHSDSVEVASICQGETYTWHGRTFTESIDVTDTLPNAVGCDSICTLHLTVLHHSDSVTNASICQGETYLWHGQIFSAETHIIDTLVNAAGCDSICSLHLTVLHHSDSVTNASICQGETYLWHGQIFSAETHIIDTLVNAVGCDSICSLHLTILHHSDSVEVASICQGETYTWHGRTFTESIDVTDTLPNAVGCDSICTLHLTVLQHSDSVEVAYICQGETYTWHGQTFAETVSLVDTIPNAVGCDSVCSLHLTVLQHSDSIETASICQGETYIWHGQTFTRSIEKTEILTNAAGCDSVCTLRLMVFQHTDSIERAAICAGDTYIWHGRTFTESTEIVDTIPNAAGCDSVCTLFLTILQHSNHVENVKICPDETYTWHGLTLSEDTDITDTLVNAVGCDSICTLRLTVLPTCTYSYDTVYFCPGMNTAHDEEWVDYYVLRYIPYTYVSPALWNYMEGAVLARERDRALVDLRRVEENLYAHYVRNLTPIRSIHWSYRSDGANTYQDLDATDEPQWIETGNVALVIQFVCGQIYTSDFATEITNIPTTESSRKIIRHGILYILRGDKIYTAQGIEIE